MDVVADEAGTDTGAPANVRRDITPTVVLRLGRVARLVRASEKMTSSRPSVAMTSAKTCAPLARWWAETLIAVGATWRWR
jgi:hypothetical protein